MKHKINPTVDCVFKAILGSEKNKNLLVHFLNAVLEPTELITEIELQNPYNERDFLDDKLTIVDVKAIDENKCQYQIEIQLALHTSISARMLYTWSKIYSSQIKKNDNFSKLNPVISIWLLKDNLFNKIDDYHLPFKLYNQKNDLILNNDIEIHLLQLSKLQKNIKTEKERWLYLFKEGKNIDVDKPPQELYTKEMRQAMEVLNKFSENQEDYWLYQNRLLSNLKENTLVDSLAKALKEKEEERQAKKQALQAKEQVQAELNNLRLQLEKRGIKL
jgi:predicted transposase/invertase (TIGR01784 family)